MDLRGPSPSISPLLSVLVAEYALDMTMRPIQRDYLKDVAMYLDDGILFSRDPINLDETTPLDLSWNKGYCAVNYNRSDPEYEGYDAKEILKVCLE